jgi:hypothetical protein
MQAFVTTQPYEITKVEEQAGFFECFVGKWGLYVYLCPHPQCSLSQLLSDERISVLSLKKFV